ncbi:glycosyltransferase family 4 protein [Pseudanabaena sp. FACHB-2040]|uniref:glycosyltransferase family 4 protein n=1 Tax=Pseudanabaena sp. FACHB-2040 TaxID=2692859 RepID=UPI001686822D|nr:glycosyltransferase family 4 protein [Pseudanabaena sp. FACHB-2040]MBD2260903.1 glycosyltransferase family 4 protein [Pseudanabaena sp. FACHB-2040]
MKFSLVVSDLSGGGAVRAFLLAQVLRQLQHEVEVIGFQFGPALYAIPPKEISVKVIPGSPYPEFFKAVFTLLKGLNSDIIYAVKPKPTSFGVALLKRLGSRCPVLLDMDDWEMSWHGGDDWQYRPTPRQLYRHLLKSNGELRQPDHPLYVRWIEGLVSRADALTVDTQFLQNRFGGVYLPNGKDTDLFDPQFFDPALSRERYGLSPYKVLMFPGAPRPHKGVEDILMALESLQNPHYRLVIIGGSPYDDYDARLQQQWGRWIIQLPRQPIAKMPEIVAAAHVVVIPQRDTLTAQAQFPLKLTDGMAMAKPILSTQVGDIPEILANTGYLAAPGSPQDLAQQIRYIFENFEEAERKGQMARERCLKLYSVHAMASTLERVIANLGQR